MNFCKCGSIEINGKCSNEHCPYKSTKNKDWVIDGRVINFKKSVTYEDAVGVARRLNTKDKNTKDLL